MLWTVIAALRRWRVARGQAIIALVGGYLALRLWRERSKKWARTLFWYSNMYLAAIFAIMVLDRTIHF
jgi:protoheme IX farnesyltransferase